MKDLKNRKKNRKENGAITLYKWCYRRICTEE